MQNLTGSIAPVVPLDYWDWDEDWNLKFWTKTSNSAPEDCHPQVVSVPMIFSQVLLVRNNLVVNIARCPIVIIMVMDMLYDSYCSYVIAIAWALNGRQELIYEIMNAGTHCRGDLAL
jgi:hypothetical protein